VALQLAVNVQTIGRAIDVPVFDIDPRAIEQPVQILRGCFFIGCADVDAAKHDRGVVRHDGVTVDHSRHSSHRDRKKVHDN